MKTAAVCIDDWKFPIFQKHLDAAGYAYEGPFPFTEGTSVLRVSYEWVHKLRSIAEAASQECGAQKSAETLGGSHV